MDSSAANRLFRMLQGDRFAFVYAGGFDEGHTAHLIPMGEAAAAERSRGHRQRLAFVMVEAYQNITRHRAAMTQGLRECSFVVRANERSDSVATVNPICNAESAALDEALLRLRGATGDQLRSFFLARLSTGGTTARGGAGLGLIEMARRSGQAMRHRLIPLDEHRKLFALRACLGESNEEAAIDGAVELHEQAIAMGLVAALRCNGLSAAQEAMLRVIERETAEAGLSQRAGQVLLAGLAWLSISGTDGLVCFGKDDQGWVVRLLWRAAPAAIADQETRVKAIAGMSRFELDRLYRRAITADPKDEATHDTALLELARLQRDALSLSVEGDVASLAVRL